MAFVDFSIRTRFSASSRNGRHKSSFHKGCKDVVYWAVKKKNKENKKEKMKGGNDNTKRKKNSKEKRRGEMRQFTRAVDWRACLFPLLRVSFTRRLGWNDSRDGTGPISHPIVRQAHSPPCCVYGSSWLDASSRGAARTFQKKLGNLYPLLGYYLYSY